MAWTLVQLCNCEACMGVRAKLVASCAYVCAAARRLLCLRRELCLFSLALLPYPALFSALLSPTVYLSTPVYARVQARHAFCAVRPPGHHAGPSGLVISANEEAGSHGFCLLSNVAIGAAYARCVHRDKGIHRVALLDFDVHHGNGTQACVAATVPTLKTQRFSTPVAEGLLKVRRVVRVFVDRIA